MAVEYRLRPVSYKSLKSPFRFLRNPERPVFAKKGHVALAPKKTLMAQIGGPTLVIPWQAFCELNWFQGVCDLVQFLSGPAWRDNIVFRLYKTGMNHFCVYMYVYS